MRDFLRFREAIWGVVLLLASGCGYTFRGGGTVLPPDVKNIYIPIVQNNSTELGLGDTVTESLREEFDSYGVVTVVDSQSEADAILTAKILNIKRNTRTVTSNTQSALQVETQLNLSAQLARVNGQVLWSDDTISVNQTFGTDRSVVVTSSASFAGGALSAGDLPNLSSREISRSQEQEVFQQMSDNIARKIYEQAVAPDF